MTQKDKELLLVDLCARLPYGVHLFTNSKRHIRLLTISNDIDYNEQYWVNGLYDIDEVKPYLRPMSSMTEEEKKEYDNLYYNAPQFKDGWRDAKYLEGLHIDWLNKHHFDYRGLIEKGSALEAPENMYEQKIL